MSLSLKDKLAYYTVLALVIFLCTVLFKQWWNSDPMPAEGSLVPIEGTIASLEFPANRYGVQGARFTLAGDPRVFCYPRFYHNFSGICETMKAGSAVRLEVTRDEKPQIWMIEVDGWHIASISEVFESKRSNDNSALLLVVIFFSIGIFVIRKMARGKKQEQEERERYFRRKFSKWR